MSSPARMRWSMACWSIVSWYGLCTRLPSTAAIVSDQAETLRCFLYVGELPPSAVCVCVPDAAFTGFLAVLGVCGPVRHEAGRRPELRTLSPTALASTKTPILAQGPHNKLWICGLSPAYAVGPWVV